MSATSPDVKSIFGRAQEIDSAAERAAFLDEACRANPDLRAEVEDLLLAMAGAGDFMERPAASGSVTVTHAPILEGPGTRIGPYKLLQQIGEGGMGVVYMAEQEQPVRRKVALKIIKPGMDSAQVIARFEAERQALAVMDHTNIARVFDAGTTDSGRPYFVMELVHGVPITAFCDENQLTPRERLELFVPVCQAIQHAHQKGIIHRDIKPSNVLVTMYDDRPVPKVIDFGVAKAIEQRLTERTLFTQFGALVGTFEYMSPEQAEMNAFGVDTRSDIYSLGVLLYELLTGTTPLEKQRLRQAALGEMVRLIKEEEPPRPSVRLSGSGDLPKIAAARKTEPTRLSKLVRGEVDWIVMKCLEKDRTRRYESASGLAKDVERYLHDEPVEACPPSAGYRLKKFARKHRTALAVAAGFLFLLVADVIVSTWQAAVARRADERARVEARRAAAAAAEALRERDLALASRREAEDRRVEADAARQSLRRSLYAADMQLAEEAWESGDVLRMRELLDGQKPRGGEDDLRGFEWHYLRRLGSTVHMARLAPGPTLGQLSPDGTHYVYVAKSAGPVGLLAGAGLELRLLDVASGREMRRVALFPGETIEANFQRTFSPDGRRFLHAASVRDASGREDRRIKVFEWETGRDVCVLRHLAYPPDSLVFDHSGRRLAVVTRRPGETTGIELRIWDLGAGQERFSIPLPGRQIMPSPCVGFSPDGAHLAALTRRAGPYDPRAASEVVVWDAGSGKEQLRFETRPGSTGVVYSPDGRRLAERGGPGASHWLRDAATGKEVLELTTAPSATISYGIAFNPDGSRLADIASLGAVRIWDVTDGGAGRVRAPEHILETKSARLGQLAWSADGRRVFASNHGGTVTSWPIAREPRVLVEGSDRTTGVTATAAAAGSRFAAAFEDPDGKTLVKVWDEAGHVAFAATDAPAARDASAGSIRRVELSRDGTRVAYAARDWNGSARRGAIARLRAWEIPSGRELFRRDDEGGSFGHLAFSSDGRRLAATWNAWHGSPPGSKYRVSSWDLETGRERVHLDAPYEVTLALSPDGRRLAAGVSAVPGLEKKGEIRVWDTTTGDVVLSRKLKYGYVSELTYNGDGTLLAAGVGGLGDVGTIQVLDADSGRERLSLAGNRYEVYRMTFGPDGRRLASLAALPDRPAEVKLWDLAGGRELLTLQLAGHDVIETDEPWKSGFAFSADGHRLFYLPGGPRRQVEMRVWDATPKPDDGPR